MTGLAALPADTFAEGPPSGAWLRADALGTPQFLSQPVQGVSALWPADEGEWFALSDNGYGAAAALKRVREVHLAGKALTSHIVTDLLDIANPQRFAGHPERFRFPFVTTEAVWATAPDEIVLANDNNFPAGGGRPGAARDATEFIRVRLARPLCAG